MNTADNLRKCADVFEKKNKEYGNVFHRLGDVFVALFPEGVELKSADDFGRFGLTLEIVTKLQRYCHNFSKGGHDDSLVDMSVYCQMILELEDEASKK